MSEEALNSISDAIDNLLGDRGLKNVELVRFVQGDFYCRVWRIDMPYCAFASARYATYAVYSCGKRDDGKSFSFIPGKPITAILLAVDENEAVMQAGRYLAMVQDAYESHKNASAKPSTDLKF